MVTAQHLSQSDYKIQPWKNGQGSTTELLVDSKNPYRWRLSTAALAQTAPFSLFDGYDRVLVLIQGGPITLGFNGKPGREIGLLSPTRFSGEWKTHCEVKNPGVDFNLFTKKNEAKGNVYTSYIAKREEVQLPIIGSEHFVYLVSGQLSLLESNLNQKVTLKEQDLYRVTKSDRKEYLNLRILGESDSVALWTVVHYL